MSDGIYETCSMRRREEYEENARKERERQEADCITERQVSDERMERLTELARRAFGEKAHVLWYENIPDLAHVTVAQVTQFSINHPRTLDMLEAALLVGAGDKQPWNFVHKSYMEGQRADDNECALREIACALSTGGFNDVGLCEFDAQKYKAKILDACVDVDTHSIMRKRAEAAASALLEMRKLADERVAAACAADHRALAAETALAELRAKVEAELAQDEPMSDADWRRTLRALLGTR